jgi:hypothetical protein
MGNVGFVYSLMGDNFYRSLARDGLAIFGEVEVTRVFAAVSDAHLRLMRRSMLTAQITLHGPCEIPGHTLNLICIENQPDTSQYGLFQ